MAGCSSGRRLLVVLRNIKKFSIMDLQQTKQTIQLIKSYQAKNYFCDNEAIQTQIRNRDAADERGQDVSMYPDSLIKKVVLSNSWRRSFYHTALPLFDAIKSNDKNYLIGHLRYDQKFSLQLFTLYAGQRLPATNKAIQDYINKM